jgi:hypothetical protein
LNPGGGLPVYSLASLEAGLPILQSRDRPLPEEEADREKE